MAAAARLQNQITPPGLRKKLASFLIVLAKHIDPAVDIPKKGPVPGGLFDRFVSFSKKLFRRIAIWTLSIAVAFYVPISEAGFPMPLAAWEQSIIHANKFSDVFLATVAMVVLSASDLVDNIIARKPAAGAINTACAWVFMIIYIVFIIYGMPAYSSSTALATHTILPWNVLIGLLTVGFAGEILIATVAD